MTSKKRGEFSFMFRILGRTPNKFPMSRTGDYIREFADLLGSENSPVFSGIKNASVGLKARVPDERQHYAHLRLVTAKTDPRSKPAKCLAKLQQMVDQDGIRQAQVLDRNENVVYLFEGSTVRRNDTPTIYQAGQVDGIVTGVRGVDDTMHLYMRDYLDRDLIMVIRDEAIARDLLQNFRKGTIRTYIHGQWKRTEYGWIPEVNKCTVDSFEVLDDTPISEVLRQFAAVPNNGWKSMEKPSDFFDVLRGED